MKKLTPTQLADKLEAKPGLLRRVLRPLLFSAVLVGLEARAHAIVYTMEEPNITSLSNNGPVSPAEAYSFGYNMGLEGHEAIGATGNPAVDAAITQGNIDAFEGLAPSAPTAPEESFNVDPANPDQAYALGYEIGSDPAFDAFAIGLVDEGPAVDAGFDAGYDAGVDGEGPSCAACGGCGSCGGCGGGGGCSSCGGGGGCGGGGCGGCG